MYHDKCFQTEVNFPFVAFSHEQMMANTTQSFLLADQQWFGNISHCLMNTDWPTLDELIMSPIYRTRSYILQNVGVLLTVP